MLTLHVGCDFRILTDSNASSLITDDLSGIVAIKELLRYFEVVCFEGPYMTFFPLARHIRH